MHTVIFSVQGISCRKIANLVQPTYQLFHGDATTVLFQQAMRVATRMSARLNTLQQIHTYTLIVVLYIRFGRFPFADHTFSIPRHVL